MNVIGERTLYGKHWNSVSLCCKRFEGSSAVENAPPHPQTIRSGDFFVEDGTDREPEQVKAGYHYGSGILPFAIFNSVWYTRLSPVNWKLWR